MALLLTVAACGTEPDAVESGGRDSGSANPGGADGGASSDGGLGADGGTADAGTSTIMPGCTATKTTAPPASNAKVDIVWIVDASGSMLDEQKRISANLTQFAESITQANIDVTITMMTTSAAIPVICPVTNPNPMVGTPLENDPRYHFIDSEVDSFNLLDVAVAEYPSYSGFLRPGASVQYVFVTDDESTYKMLPSPAERTSAFVTDMSALLGHGFTAHTIASEGPEACNDPMCMPDTNTGLCVFAMLGCGAAAPGDTYYALSEQTSGVTASICQSDWTNLFTKLRAAVIASAPLPCEYQIPPPPSGETLDPMRVNVAYTAPGAAETVFPKAAGQASCGSDLGWYYDNDSAPKEVRLCPGSCNKATAGGSMNIAFGCETVLR